MSGTTKTVLIVGGAGVLVYLLYRATQPVAPAAPTGTLAGIAGLAKGLFGTIVGASPDSCAQICDKGPASYDFTRCQECRDSTRTAGIFGGITDLGVGIVEAFR